MSSSESSNPPYLCENYLSIKYMRVTLIVGSFSAVFAPISSSIEISCGSVTFPTIFPVCPARSNIISNCLAFSGFTKAILDTSSSVMKKIW